MKNVFRITDKNDQFVRYQAAETHAGAIRASADAGGAYAEYSRPYSGQDWVHA